MRIYMKFKVVISLLVVSLLGVACSNSRIKQGVQVADKFIENYYRADYIQAMEYAEPNLAELVKEAQQAVDELPEEIKEELHTLSSEIEVIQKEFKEGDSGEVMVWYDVIVPADGEIINHLVTVIFSEERQKWEVVEIR